MQLLNKTIFQASWLVFFSKLQYSKFPVLIFWSSLAHPNWEDLTMKSPTNHTWNLSMVTRQHEKYHFDNISLYIEKLGSFAYYLFFSCEKEKQNFLFSVEICNRFHFSVLKFCWEKLFCSVFSRVNWVKKIYKSTYQVKKIYV